jgi:xanthine/CO dehydrogenase XdhC/CoxF family maturation factor
MVFGDTFNSPLERNVVNVGKEIGFKTIEHNPLGACGQPDLATSSLDIESLKIPEGAYVVLVTRGVNDAPLLKYLSKFNLNYVGVVASENRWEATKEELRKSGVRKEFIERVHAPAGIDINSILLEEIAISILAEIIEVRRMQLFDEAANQKKERESSTKTVVSHS